MSENPENNSNRSPAAPVDTDSELPESAETNPAKHRETLIMKAVTDFESPLIGYATTILHDPDLAREVVQDTFLRLCQQDLAKVSDHLKSWLFTVCRNRALDVLRKDKRTEALEEMRWKRVAGPGLQPDEMLEHVEQAARLASYLDRLSDNQRECILLKFQHDLNYQEIHLITGLTTSNVGFLIHTGIRRLREILPDDFRA